MKFVKFPYSPRIFALLFLTFCWTPLHAASIFILHAYSQEYNWTKRQHAGFVEQLGKLHPQDVLVTTEYLDTKRRSYDAEYAREMARHLAVKYAGYRPDVIYVTDDNGLSFARSHLSRVFPGVPIVFSGVNNYAVLDEIDHQLVTGVFEKKEISPNLGIMTSLGMAGKTISFVGDTSNTYDAIKHEIGLELTNYPGTKAVFLSSDDIEEIVSGLQQCQCGYVYLTTIGGIRDRSGGSMSLREIVTTIANAGDFALLSMEDAYLFDGVVGGYVTSGRAQGVAAARLVDAILSGTPVTDLPPITESPNEYIFDERALKRLGISLPDRIRQISTIINPGQNFYQANRALILGTIVVLSILLFIVLIVAVVMLSIRRTQLKQVASALTAQKDTLLETQESLEMAQQIAHMGSWSLDLVNNQLSWSDEIYRIFEIDKTNFDASYEAFLNAIHPEDRDLVNRAYSESVKNRAGYEIEHRLLTPDGRIKYVQERGITRYDAKDQPIYSYGSVQDITQKKLDEKRLRQWASIFESTIEAVVITDTEQNIVDVNRAFTEITGYSKREVLGKRPNIRRSQRHDNDFYKAMWDSINNNGSWTGEIWNRTKNGELSPEWHSISTIYDENGKVCNYVGVFTDISVLKRSEEKLEHLANHDPLTGLANRGLLTDRLERILRHLEREARKLAVLFLDLDRFKKVNDTQGHPVGDILLQQAAARLKAAIRSSDTIGRLGGDEFLVLIEYDDNLGAVKAVVEKLRDVIEQPFEINGSKLYISVSIGISIYPDDGTDGATLIRNADSALYRAKETGRNNYSFYDYEITRLASSRLEIENVLRQAMDKDAFCLFYQPKINLNTGRVMGAEALIRLQMDDGRLLSPDEFIPVAEETGLIIPIGKWVLEQALRQLASWHAAGHSLQIAVNISAIQIQRGDIMQTIEMLQHKYQFDPADLELEVTESVLIDFPEKAVEVLTGARKAGLSVALDDFGTGFSSLSNLKRYPISTIKVDKSFVMDILDDPNDAAITRAVVAMGHSLDMQVVAEGVESAEHVSFLQDLGCHLAQGYYYSRPIPIDEFDRRFLSPDSAALVE
jgi:diguanylate cyclase (GGDEF)-like protein/PAS domain S-box-containing protein